VKDRVPNPAVVKYLFLQGEINPVLLKRFDVPQKLSKTISTPENSALR
jgi:hypothetical protein